jgi:hypothetical protein
MSKICLKLTLAILVSATILRGESVHAQNIPSLLYATSLVLSEPGKRAIYRKQDLRSQDSSFLLRDPHLARGVTLPRRVADERGE